MLSKEKIIWLVVVIPLVLSSCVAKKKFLEMEAGRLKAEQKVRELDQANIDKSRRIDVLIADYESLKSEMLESNAIKGQYIDSLRKEMTLLSSDVNQTSETLEEKQYAFEFEKRRLNNVVSEKDNKILSLNNEVVRLKNEIREKTSVVSQKSFEISQQQSTISKLESEKLTQVNKLQENLEKLDQLQKIIAQLQAQIKEKDETITRLSNNVKLLKSQLGK